MSDAPEYDNATASSEQPVPENLETVATPVRVRRSPLFGRFIGTGVAIGILVSMVLALFLPNSTGVGRFMVFVVLTLGLGLIGALGDWVDEQITVILAKHGLIEEGLGLDEGEEA